MRTLNHQAVLNRVYRHFVIERHPPGIRDSRVLYHQADENGTDCPCAIGVFDKRDLLDATVCSGLACPDVDSLAQDHPDVLAEVFGVDELSWDDVHFLKEIQVQHDCHAMRHFRVRNQAPNRFAFEFAASLERIAREYALKPLAF